MGVVTVIYENSYDIILDDVFLHLGEAIPELDVYLKVEGVNPAGSIKLKTAVGMVEDAAARGVLRPGDRIIESSSGSLGVALSMVCAAREYHFICVTDKNASPLSLDVMRALGAEVVEVDRRDSSGGFLGSRISYIEQRLADEPELLWLNQYANPANPLVHANRTAAAITAEISDIDYLFVGAGTSGTLMGCIRHFRKFSPGTKIIAVDAVGSVSFGRPAGPRYLPGIGSSRRPEILRSEAADDLVLISEPDTVRTCRWLARRHGVFAGGSTGSVVCAILRYRPRLPPGSRVVAISPDFGDRYARTIYDDAWVAEKFGPTCLSDAAPEQAFCQA
jgi:N-(2-amino-2-carboxyethyl)-L-glutamate synthase